jgi:hypothetical protein
MTSEQCTSLWDQFGAAIDMFQNALEKCPDELWDRGDKAEYMFWYWAYHTLFWTDYYLDTDPVNFVPPERYNMSEFDPEGKLPDHICTKAELIDYAKHCREKLRKLINDFIADPDLADRKWRDDRESDTLYEMELYNMRHVMHHTGQLNMLLGQIDHSLPVWVSHSKEQL